MGSRLITDRFEWHRLATELAASPYHHPGWSWSSVRRIAAQTSLRVGCGYLRVWHDDTLVGCPIIALGGETFNSPRTWPQVLSGPKLSDRALGHVVAGAIDGLVLHNDEAQLAAIRSVAGRLSRLSADVRVFASITRGDLDAIAAAVPWSAPPRRDQWLHALTELGRTSWDVGLCRHLDIDSDVIGWSVSIALTGRPGTAVVAAAVQAGVEPPQWGSPR